MKLFKAGDKGKAICESCKEIAPTTFAYRDVPFSDSPGKVKGILVSVCDKCDSVVAVPSQSTPAIKAARETATKSIEVNLPASYIELLDLAAFKIDAKATAEFRKRLLAFYIHRYAVNPDFAEKMAVIFGRLPHTPKSTGGAMPKKRLSFKFTPRLNSEFEEIMKASSLNRTDVIRGLVLQIDKDIVRPKKPKHLTELQTLAAVATC